MCCSSATFATVALEDGNKVILTIVAYETP